MGIFGGNGQLPPSSILPNSNPSGIFGGSSLNSTGNPLFGNNN
jgi:hypothetical protein